MRRTMQTVAIPVFQFGIFSENDQSFFAGPNFAFGGRVHTNQHLFLKQDDGNTLTLQDRGDRGRRDHPHASRQRRDRHAQRHGAHGAARRAARRRRPRPTRSCRDLRRRPKAATINNLGSADNEPTWTNISTGTYNSWIRNGRTGARRLDLPIVSDGAAPVDLIRRPPAGEAATSDIGRQRFYNLATLRILISDRAAGSRPPCPAS